MHVDEFEHALFSQCRFAIIRSPGLDEATAEKLLAILRLHGGEASLDKYSEHKLAPRDFTHIISATSDFPDYDAACDALIPVIKPSWIDASLAKDKLANPRQYNPDPRLFLSDVVVCCADLPEGDKDAIEGGVLAMGGLFTSRVTNQVTHIVALTMDSEKCTIVQSRKMNVKIVLPHWFDDCLRLGKRIDERPYLLPDPEMLQQVNTVPPRAVESKSVAGAVHPDPSRTVSAAPAPPSRKDLNVFTKKAVMLANDLGIGSRLRETLESLITDGGGRLVTNVRNADMYVCKYREGDNYRAASRAGKEVGNLAWLYYLITNNIWTAPTRRMLHYPVTRKGLPGFQGFRISLSNYSGDARVYLENLIVAAGAECTKTLKQDNTHLITAHIMSEKCSAAKEWSIHLVNHLWLEESYSTWKMQSVTNTRYTHFPHRTNLGEVVGQTKLDRNALEQNFFPDDDTDTEYVEEPAPSIPQDGRPSSAGQVPPSSMIDSPKASGGPGRPLRGGPATGTTASGIIDVGKVGEPTKVRTPAASRFIAMGKENETPSTTGSRKSKDVAATKLGNMAEDIALYEKEKKRVGGVIYGGRRKNDVDRVVSGRKRPLDEDDDSDAIETHELKRVRKNAPQLAMHLLISGYKKWVNHPKVEDNDKKWLRSLGVIVTQDPSRASHLAAPTILRTHKFITALAYAPMIISTDFIDACLEKDELLDPGDYTLQDKASEKKFDISLAVSRDRAETNRNLLFQGHTIYCVEKIHGGFETFRSIIEANGGQCNMYRGRADMMVPSRRADSNASGTDEDAHAEVYLISGAEKEQTRVWHRFKQMAEGSRKVPRILRPDWLLETAMAQKILPVEKYQL